MCVCVCAWRTSKGVKIKGTVCALSMKQMKMCALFTSIAFNMPSIWCVCVFVCAVHNFPYGRTQKKNHLTHTTRTHARPHSPHGHAKHETQKNAKWNFNDADNRFSRIIHLHSFRIRIHLILRMPLFVNLFFALSDFSVSIVAPTFKRMSNNQSEAFKAPAYTYMCT